MKREFSTYQDLLNNLDPEKQQICETIDQIFSKLITRHIFKTNSINLIGYGTMHYKCSTYDGPYPFVSFAPQKNNVSLYLMLFIEGKPYIEKYTSIFGKSNVGKGCIRIKKLNSERINALKEIADFLHTNYPKYLK